VVIHLTGLSNRKYNTPAIFDTGIKLLRHSEQHGKSQTEDFSFLDVMWYNQITNKPKSLPLNTKMFSPDIIFLMA